MTDKLTDLEREELRRVEKQFEKKQKEINAKLTRLSDLRMVMAVERANLCCCDHSAIDAYRKKYGLPERKSCVIL